MVLAGWALPGGNGLLQLEHVTQDIVSSARSSNLQWLEDCAVRLLCVLALDRFGDFTSDQVLQCLAATISGHKSTEYKADCNHLVHGIEHECKYRKTAITKTGLGADSRLLEHVMIIDIAQHAALMVCCCTWSMLYTHRLCRQFSMVQSAFMHSLRSRNC